MQNLKLILILNTSSNEVCEYYPRNTSLEFLDETKTLMSSFKGGFTQGSVQTKENIYYYNIIHIISSSNSYYYGHLVDS